MHTRATPPSYLREPELLVLTVLSLLTRCWMLFYPDAVVWDEKHYERFAGAYLTHRYYVDVHPPLAKMLVTWFGVLFGVDASTFAGNQPAPAARILPAVAGALIIPVVYLIVRELGGGRRTAAFAAVLLLLDNGLMTESRLILTDGLLLLFGMSALLCYLIARRHGSARRAIWVVLSALLAGAAASTKWTGLSALGLILLLWLVDTIIEWRERNAVAARLAEAAALVTIPVAVYLGAFALHFALLNHSGTGDSLMSDRFRHTLVGNVTYEPGATMPLLDKTVELNRLMQRINKTWATDSNPGASKWYTWPIAKHSIGFYLRQTQVTPDIEWIIMFGNPIVWLGALGGMLLVVVQLARGDDRLRTHRGAFALLGAGYLLNFLPFAPIARPMYLYHYFFALIFSIMFASLGIGDMLGWDEDGAGHRWVEFRHSRVWGASVGAAFVLFAYMAPLSYGWPLSPSAVRHRQQVLQRHP